MSLRSTASDRISLAQSCHRTRTRCGRYCLQTLSGNLPKMLSLASILAILPALVLSAPVIQLPIGQVRGTDQLAQDSQKPYITFYGIPFAKPPVKELRFKPPQPFVGTGPNVVISSGSFRPACLQNSPGKTMSEDCLYLNVFTPPDVSTLKKVMFWVYGGSFQTGDAAEYVPSQLVTDKDVIVVIANYRVGLFGFLTSQNGDANNGLRDQILALKWTKENIEAFGGDPTDITVFGESAGAASLSILSISPRTRGLFIKAIFQSGTALSGWAINRHPAIILDAVAEKLVCKSSAIFRRTRSIEEINCIRTKTVDKLQAVSSQLSASADSVNTDMMCLPAIDGDVIFLGPECLLANATYLKDNGVLDRTYMAGVNNNEGMYLVGRALAQAPGVPSSVIVNSFTTAESAEGLVKLGAGLVSPNCPIGQCKLQLLNYQYTQPRDSDGHTSPQNVFDLVSEALFIIPTIQFVRALVKASNIIKFYLYLFDHYPQLLNPDGPFHGTSHGVDLSYEFDTGAVNNLGSFYAKPPQPSEKNVTELLLTTVSQFAINGNPVGPSGPTWPPYDRKDEYFFRISLTPKVDQHVYAKRVALWTDIVLKRNKTDCDPCRGDRNSHITVQGVYNGKLKHSKRTCK